MLYPAVFGDLSELERRINKISVHKAKAIGICPGPALADKYREYLQRIGSQSFDVVTVFKFAQNLLTCDQNFDSSRFFNKSTLLLSLATLWKANLPELSLADFQLAHKIFTDLRGHFLVPDFLETVLADFRPEIKRCVIYFWHFLQSANILDEHGVYGELAHQLRTPAHPAYEYLPTQTYLFFGFRHFTGVQVDFLKSLAIKHDVHIFIPSPAYLNSRATDWITWLFPDRNTGLPSDRSILLPRIRCKVIRPSLNKHSKLLIRQLTDAGSTNVILGKNDLNSSDLCSIYQDNYFKLETQFFSGIFESVRKRVLAQIEAAKDGRLTIDELNKSIDDDCKKKLAEKDFGNQRAIKVMLLIRKSLKNWAELSTKNLEVDSDIWKMICESAQLDLPRNYLIPVAFSRHSSSIMPISGLELDDSVNGSIFVVSEQFGEIISENNVFADSVIQTISQLSPLRSTDLEKYFFRFWFDVFVHREENTLLYEQGIDEKSFFWKMILGPLNDFESKDLSQKKTVSDVLARYIKQSYQHKTLSPSRLQNYYDCPRKFYFQEFEECRLDRRSMVQLESFELGEIEHLVIKDFFEQNLEFQQEVVSNLVELHLRDFLAKRILQIKIFSLATTQKEILEYSMNGIRILNGLITQYHFTSVKFEVSFVEIINGIQFKGRIDCVLENEQAYAILDFKRGGGSIPSLKALDKFEKLQIWFYLSHFHVSKKVLCFGLICLSTPDKSILRIVTENAVAPLVTERDDLSFKSIGPVDYDRRLTEYQAFEEGLVRDLYADYSFKASPIKAQICEFCDLSALCSKGQL
ncbi:MAG: PD-(D/E)XK nuclease family protein [Bdellovibrionota bacterium]